MISNHATATGTKSLTPKKIHSRAPHRSDVAKKSQSGPEKLIIIIIYIGPLWKIYEETRRKFLSCSLDPLFCCMPKNFMFVNVFPPDFNDLLYRYP